MRTPGETGRQGEDFAAGYLERNGYTILARNFRVRQGEIDLIAECGGYVAFIEVKTRADGHFAKAREFVTLQKQRRLVAASLAWLVANPSALQPRFDVIEVYWPKGAALPRAIQHLENAFEG
ncbi:MAG: YraN family protein [Intestinibacillus sp.]